MVNTKNFEFEHEQERMRAIARYLHLPYQERFVNVEKPKGKTFAINMNVSEGVVNRLNFNFRHIEKLIKKLRECGCRFKVIRDASQVNIELVNFYKQFFSSEIIDTHSFQGACKVIDSCHFYLGVDSGLGHYAVQSGKIVFALYSLKHHGKIPLFQSTFRNHLCYFGDTSFSGKLLSDFRQIEKTYADKNLLGQITQFLKYGKGVNVNPYSNERKVFALTMAFLNQDEYRENLAREIHANSASIFFADEVIGLNIKELTPLPGKIFIDSISCTQKLNKAISHYPSPRKVSLYAKACSFFYGTAMKDGSSDVDLPTLRFSGRMLRKKELLKRIELILNEFGFSTKLPHQTPIISTRTRLLLPIIKNGHSAFLLCYQKDENNFQKYESRIKIKIVLGEMSRLERQELEASLLDTARGRHLLKGIKYLESESEHFKEWENFVRKIIRATSILGDFGAKGHVFIRVEKQDCKKIAEQINGLMRHGIIYAIGARLYPLWNIRRPQHGWFQPITILAESPKVFANQIKKALESPIYSSSQMNTLKSLSDNKLSSSAAIELLASPNPLIFIEAYRYIAFHNKEFGRNNVFFQEENSRNMPAKGIVIAITHEIDE